MPLKITKSSDPIEVSRITVCIYAQPGVGRTSTGFTADRPLLLDFDQGAYRSAFRKDSVQINSWADVEGLDAEALAPYGAIVVDTVGRCLDVMARDIIKRDPKAGRGSGDLTLQGFGILKARFAGWLSGLHALGHDVVLLAHMDEQRKGDETIERLDIQGSSRQEVYKVADAMGRLIMAGGKRRLNFNPGDAAFGKNPASLPVFDVPDFAKEPAFLASIIQTIKDRLNEGSESQRLEAARMETLRELYLGLDGADAFNHRAKELALAEPKVKALLVQVAESKGLKLDKTKTPARFVAVETPAASPAEAKANGAPPATSLEAMIEEGARVLGLSDLEMKLIRSLHKDDPHAIYNELNEIASNKAKV